MIIEGVLSKMGAKPGEPYVSYVMRLGETSIDLALYLGQFISLTFTGTILCVGCGKSIKKSYQQGYCFPCTQRLAQCDFCILKPERCHYHLGTCREPRWGETHCMIPHYVYLANTTGVKVGITRTTQIPTRWLDQGAISALPIIQVSSRRLSGFVEVLFAKKISDKTDWRKLLQGRIENIDLQAEQNRLQNELSVDLQNLISEWGESHITMLEDQTVFHFTYPVLAYPQKIHSLSWDKTPIVEGTLLGIKGQYLILDTGVINIRKHTGYVLKIDPIA